MTCRKSVFPFTAIVGQEKMKKALILNAINLNLGGVLIRGEKGTAKSTAARALANLLPDIDFVRDCPFNCSPYRINEMCPSCFKRHESGEELPSIRRKMRVVELPLGATEDRVIGSIDIESAIKKGEKEFEPGILADVNRGILYVDEINLLDDHIVDVLLDAAAMGVNYVEREGVSFSHPARFILVGTMNPEEGELRPQLLDRFGMCIDVEGIDAPDLRVQVMKRYMEYEKDHHAFEHLWDDEEHKLAEAITGAEEIIPNVIYDESILNLIADIVIEMGVDGHRADIFILKVSCTIAAYHGRTEVTPDDVMEAAELVLNHRMRRKPFQEQGVDRDKLSEAVEKSKKKTEHGNEKQRDEHKSDREMNESGEPEETTPKEEIFEAESDFIMKNILKASERKVVNSGGRRTDAASDNRRGRYVTSRIPAGKVSDIAVDATIRAAAPNQVSRGRSDEALIIRSSDMREKVRERKAGSLIVFVVDSSGSMGAAKRMSEAKGAVLALLNDAYQKRDMVSLVAFKGNDAFVALNPTGSIELAKKNLEDIPTGGKTPLSSGMGAGLHVINRELQKNPRIKPLMVLISDGRGNVSFRNSTPFEEAKEIAADIKSKGIGSIVIDTESGLVRLGRLGELAEIMGGKYYGIDDLRSDRIHSIVRENI